VSAVSAPFGFKPIFHPSGVIRPKALTNGIASAYNTAIYVGQPVKMLTTGVLAAAGAGDAIVGIFAGCEYVPSGGRPSGGYWPANQAYDSSQPMVAYYYDDPEMIYAVQCDGSLAQTSVFDEADYSNTTAGSTITGLSACTLSSTLKGSGNQGQWRVMDVYALENNAWGDAYTIVEVRVANHQFGGVQTAA